MIKEYRVNYKIGKDLVHWMINAQTEEQAKIEFVSWAQEQPHSIQFISVELVDESGIPKHSIN
jgi:hypothetical protein